MRILLFGINYAPELTGIGKYTGELAEYLAAQGDEVEVVTAPPYYPQWAIQAPYTQWTWTEERIGGVTVLRCPLYVPSVQSGLKRIAHELTFLASSLRWWGPRMLRPYDVILAVSPPFHLPLLPLAHRLLHGTPVVNHIQDLQVDAARELGLISSERLLGAFEWVERKLLASVDVVSSISAGMIGRIAAKGVARERIWSVPNWVDEEVVHPVPDGVSLRERFGIPDGTRVVLYSGNLGAKQGLDAIPRLAQRFAGDDAVRFLVVGEGGAKAQLLADVERLGLANVQFETLQPLADLSALLATADVHLVLQRKAAADLVMPSKLTNIVAVGGHAVITAEPGTTLYEVARAERIGTVVEPENDAALEGAVRRILAGEAAADATGVGAYATQLYKSSILAAFRHRLLALTAAARKSAAGKSAAGKSAAGGATAARG